MIGFGLRAHKTIDSIFTLFVPPERFWIDAVSRVIDTSIMFCNPDDDGTSLSIKFSSPISDITEPLNDDSFSSHSRFNPKFATKVLVLQNLSP